MDNEVAITGIGLFLPDINDPEALWQAWCQGDSKLTRAHTGIITNFVSESQIKGRIPARVGNKLDNFSKFALIASERAMSDAKLPIDSLDKDKVGVFVGNVFGGWQYTDRELRNLHCDGPRAVSPFQATAWFPAAAQGQISITHGFKGYSKTYMCDRSSSLHSISDAAYHIGQGHIDVAIAGGTECINTDFVLAALAQTSEYTGRGEFNPFSKQSNELGFTEGAVFFVLESKRGAQSRGATIYGYLGGSANTTQPTDADRYNTTEQPFIRNFKSLNGAPDVILPDACGLHEVDKAEALAINELYPQSNVVVPKRIFGHGLGFEGALDVACACLLLKHQNLPQGELENAYTQLSAQSPNSKNDIDQILINTASLGGAISSLIIKKGTSS
ncbi:beta-ketoacyl synthase N-terminal-like domain-containing protein [Pseudoalteromonas luteoviolacea]|uniref:Ketosynthase family 3 (KS3) domain-containing protein n=1 Tax=Pseudoalteromonas luteoviolacea S4060-1 TaxID=1365257 RepID=A0A167L6A1_9GAMM|nr:beta-ketoacyl synthase N-terminal-like domain-containing protein [Pseudoalteromonas luteoviolacea]KZN63883.1 hypothetical protein N478_23330 [Pseudoalteromonas luteoviolacea S4060-1]